MIDWYFKFLVRRPYFVILGITVFSLACIIVSLTLKDLPNFSEPTLGFESRGTEIGKRLTSWYNLQRETHPSGKLVIDPNDLLLREEFESTSVYATNDLSLRKKHKKKKNKKKNSYKNKLKIIKNLLANESSTLTLSSSTTIPPLPSSSSSVMSNFSNDDDYGTYIKDYDETNASKLNDRRSHYEYGKNMSYIDEDDQEIIQSKNDKWIKLKNFDPITSSSNFRSQIHLMNNGYFCQSPDREYSHFVVEKVINSVTDNASKSLFEINSLLAMCQLEQQILDIDVYENYCERELFSNNCCKPWSLPNYIALLSNKTTCFDIDEDDIVNVQNLLLNCFEYFHSLKLSDDCQEDRCRAPIECVRHNAVYNILHYLTDINFIKLNDTNVFLTNSMIFVPIAKSTKILEFFYVLEKSNLKNDLVNVVAMDLGLKNALFDESLLYDCWLVGLGGIFVMTCMWIYTSSIFVTLMTVVAVCFSLGIAYFMYFLVFEMSFFPFMNLLAVVVLIGIGADDAFIFVKIWQCMLTERIKSGSPVSVSEPNSTEFLNNLMGATLRHSATSMFVTSLTTAGAFYASYVSSITAVKCFGVFAGTAILSNYILMITWLPASISIMERIPYHFGNLISTNLSQKLLKSINQIGSMIENLIIRAVNGLPILWILLFGIFGICSCVAVLYWPRLQLPESKDFRLFVSDHPFELYDTKFKDQFWFEKSVSSIDNFKLPLRFVWGIVAIDNGDYTDPYSKGDLLFDNNFNVSTLESQKWLLNFCKRIKSQPFYQATFGLLVSNCFIENFISWMNRRCIDRMNNADRTPCCEISKFPYESHVFDYCLPKCISSLHATPRQFFVSRAAGPRFAKNPLSSTTSIENNKTVLPPIVKALVVEYESNFSYSASYLDMKHFTQTVETWFAEELKTAPSEMKGGWFISELDFFDLQDSLTNGTISAIMIAMCTSLAVLFLVTLNVLVSLYAAVNVFLTILTTITILILLEWKLNILESVSVSTAIGLAVDFSLHYGMHYCLSSNTDRASAATFSLSRIIGPTAMAAITTGAAGALMLPSNVLPYIQIGLFLVIVMSVSWTYSTLFLMSILRVIGPEHRFLQFSYPRFKKRKNLTNSSDPNTINRVERHADVSEHLLTPSDSAVGDIMNSESHELDSLTSNSLIKTTKPIAVVTTTSNILNYSRPINHYDNISNHDINFFKDYRSPSTGSAITVVLPDDNDMKI